MRVGLVEHLNHTRFKLLELSVSWNDAFGGCGPTQVHGAARSTAVFIPKPGPFTQTGWLATHPDFVHWRWVAELMAFCMDVRT